MNSQQQQTRSRSPSIGFLMPPSSFRKNTKQRSILMTSSFRMHDASLSTELPSGSILYPSSTSIISPIRTSEPITFQSQLVQQQQQQSTLTNKSTLNIKRNNPISSNKSFSNFINHFKKQQPHHSSQQLLHSRNSYFKVQQLNTGEEVQSQNQQQQQQQQLPQQSQQYQHVKKSRQVSHSLPPPRVTRLLHAVEDRDAKVSRDNLEVLQSQKERGGSEGRLQSKFQLIRSEQNIPKIQSLMCEFIDNHRQIVCNKDAFRLTQYERSAPFYVETMGLADEYLDDQKLVHKHFGYEDGNLVRNSLHLEKIMLERLIKQQQSMKTNSKKKSQQQYQQLKQQSYHQPFKHLSMAQLTHNINQKNSQSTHKINSHSFSTSLLPQIN